MPGLDYITQREVVALLVPLLGGKEERRVLDKVPPVSPPSLPTWEGSPFPGLRAFTPDDAPIFFGRQRETDGLVAKLAEPGNRFIVVVGGFRLG